MKKISLCLRTGLCLLLVLQLVLPPEVWAGKDHKRGLQVDALKKRAALWVLTIGVSEYEDKRISLLFADHDAEMIAKVLKTQEGVLFREVFTRVLVNPDATREGILKAMSEFLGQASQDDVILLFLAGHGVQDRRTGSYYFLPHNANGENLIYTGLPMSTFEEAVKRLQTHVDKLVLWLDTCHAGAMRIGVRGVDVGEDLYEALDSASGQYVLSASKAGEESLEDESFVLEGQKRAHGAFTYSLLRGLQGEAADTTGVVWLSDLFGHVSREVPRLTQGQQHPHGQIEGTDLPLFVLGEPEPADTTITLADTTITIDLTTGTGGKKWWWLLFFGTAVVWGGVGVVLAGDGDKPEPTGGVEIDVQVP